MTSAQPFLQFVDLDPWQAVTKFDARGAQLADRHYSRRTVGSPPGLTYQNPEEVTGNGRRSDYFQRLALDIDELRRARLRMQGRV